MTDALSPYTAVLLASYGGPRRSEDVLPFMRNATAGRGVPDERLIEVSRHYELFGGRSPINEQNEALRDALVAELERRGCPREVMIGNRNWTPFFSETVGALRDGGHERVVALATAAYSSYSSCRQYHEDLDKAMLEFPEVSLEKVGPYWAHDGFIVANVASLVDAVQSLRSRLDGGRLRVLFVTHSIPIAMNELSSDGSPERRYDAQHLQVAQQVAQRAGDELGEQLDWELTYCSRSGAPHIPWLEPDVSDRIGEITEVEGVVVAPIGFISDHMEVAFDLDTEARQAAADAGLLFERAATVGTHPAFIASLADLLLEQAAIARGDLDHAQHPCLRAVTSCCHPRHRKDPHVPPAPARR